MRGMALRTTETIIFSIATIKKPMQLAMRPNSGFDGFHWNGTVSSKWKGMWRTSSLVIAALLVEK